MSVPTGLTAAFVAENGVYKADVGTFDVIAHHTQHLNEFLAPSKRRHADPGPDDDAAEDVDDGVTEFDVEPDD